MDYYTIGLLVTILGIVISLMYRLGKIEERLGRIEDDLRKLTIVILQRRHTNNQIPWVKENPDSASFGITPNHAIDTTRLNYEKALKLLTHRVRVYTRHGTATYNTDLDEFEEVDGDENELRKITKDAINALQH